MKRNEHFSAQLMCRVRETAHNSLRSIFFLASAEPWGLSARFLIETATVVRASEAESGERPSKRVAKRQQQPKHYTLSCLYWSDEYVLAATARTFVLKIPFMNFLTSLCAQIGLFGRIVHVLALSAKVLSSKFTIAAHFSPSSLQVFF